MSNVKELASQQEFDTLLASGKVIFVDFYADWCGPCKAISPHFQKIASEHADKEGVEFYKINIDNVQELAEALGIRSIPTFHAYKDGKRLDQIVGANPGGLAEFVTKNAPEA